MITVLVGDALEKLKELPDESVLVLRLGARAFVSRRDAGRSKLEQRLKAEG